MNYKFICLIITLLLITHTTYSKANAYRLGFELDLNIAKSYQSLTYDHIIITPTNLGILTLNLKNNELYMLLNMSTYKIALTSNNTLVGISRSLDSSYIILISNNSLTLIKSNLTSVLYDVLPLEDEVLSVGYTPINTSYKLLITEFKTPEGPINHYIANCTACYGKKLLRDDTSTLIIGSIYSRDPNYLWSYNVFVGKVIDNYLVGKYVGLEGNDDVVDAYIVNDYIYIVINSELSGLYIAIVDLKNLNISTYRVLVNNDFVRCSSTSIYGNDILMIVNDLNSNYLLILTTQTLIARVFNLGKSLTTLSVVDEYLITLNYYVNTSKTYLTLHNTTEFFRDISRFSSGYASLRSTNAYLADLRLTITKYSSSYEVINNYLIPKQVGVISDTYANDLDVMLNNYTATLSKPLYEFRGREVVRSVDILLIVGFAFVISSIILKYFARVRS